MTEWSIPFLHGTALAHLPSAPSCRAPSAPPPPALRMEKRTFISCLASANATAPHPLPSPEDSSNRKGERKGRGCNNPKPSHLSSPSIDQQTQFSASPPLFLAHNQTITQGFAEKRREAIGPALPLPVWEWASHYIQKGMHLFPEVAWGRQSRKESQIVAKRQ